VSVGAELDLTRLAELERVLGTGSAEIAANLAGEISNELDRIESGLEGGDMRTVAQAAHAARNSVLIFDAHKLLNDLGTVETAARADDGPGVAHGAALVRESWPPVRDALARAADQG